MPPLREICDRIETTTSSIRQHASERQWSNYSRQAFVGNLSKIIPEMEQLQGLFELALHEIDGRNELPKPEISPHIKEISQLIIVLKRNRELEQARIDKIRAQGIGMLAETIVVPELYSDLEQKTLAIILKSTYAIERMRVYDRKKDNMMKTSGAQKSVLDLLDKREKELEDLRKKYEETRSKTFLGLLEKEGSIEIENELNEISRQLEAKTELLKTHAQAGKKGLEEMQRAMGELFDKVSRVEELEGQALGKTFELITMLKKERDYAKKVLIEIEQETLQLRNTYSKELLNLQEEKIGLKNSLDERHEKEVSGLREDIRQKAQTIEHLQHSLILKEKKISALEEEQEQLRLINKAFHKHHTVKQHLSGKKKKKSD